MLNRQTVFALFSLSVVFVLVVPSLVQHGMFMDGVQYACVAKNLALGKGTFWFPYLSESWVKSGSNFFMEHPPLSYYLQSKFFLVFGNSVYGEKLYCLFAVIICSYLIYKIWTTWFNTDPILKQYWWLTILLWFITPSVFWSFRNNMIENTVSVMVLASVYFSLKAFFCKTSPLIYLIVAGVFIFLGTLCKGLPALFPVTIFVFLFLFFRNISIKKTFFYSLLIVCVPILIYAAILFSSSTAYESLSFYFEKRLLARIDGEHIVENRFTTLFWLLTDMFVILGIVVVLFAVFRSSIFKTNFKETNKRAFLFFMVLGISGVAPLCLTHVQRATYFVPAIPFFAIAFAVFIANVIHPKLSSISEKTFKTIRFVVVSLAFTFIVVTYFLFGKTGRDHEIIQEVTSVGKIVPRGESIGATNAVYSQWDFQFYLLRYYDIVLFPSDKENVRYFINEKENVTFTLGQYKNQVIFQKFALTEKL